jgi:hypothetical protein
MEPPEPAAVAVAALRITIFQLCSATGRILSTLPRNLMKNLFGPLAVAAVMAMPLAALAAPAAAVPQMQAQADKKDMSKSKVYSKKAGAKRRAAKRK